LTKKVGQLFMVAAYSNKDDAHYDAIEKLITENKIGGLIFFKEDLRQANLTNRYQSKSKNPCLLVSMPNGDLVCVSIQPILIHGI
jgi:hypothetical protein